jgi:putative SOS response-associated peptidase YedK
MSEQRDDGKQPYRFRRKDLEPFACSGAREFARLGGGEVVSAAMIVGEPNPLVGGVHDRMPVILLAEDRWLGSELNTGRASRPDSIWCAKGSLIWLN